MPHLNSCSWRGNVSLVVLGLSFVYCGNGDTPSTPTRSFSAITAIPESSSAVAASNQAAPPNIRFFTATPSNIEPGKSSKLAWATSRATSCSITDGVGDVRCTSSTFVSPSTSTTYTLTVTGPGGTSTATVDVTVPQCHAITAVKGGFVDTPGVPTPCPTGATEFCEAVPIVATDNAQAGRACAACFGAANCTNQFGNFWFGVVSVGGESIETAFMNAQLANGNCIGRPGEITNGWFCPESRWAP